MNDLIKKLAMVAKDHATHLDKIGVDTSYENIFNEVFAKLIVRECCEVAHCNFHVDGLTLGGIMKKHFGVEE